MLADDTVDYPMTVAIGCYYSGTIDIQRLVEAARLALRVHPLLSARVRGDLHLPTRHITWQHNPAEPQVLLLRSHAEAFPRHLNLYEESGLRLIHIDDSENPCLIVLWHHACCDGAGIFQFLETLMLAYRDGRAALEGLQQQAANKQWWNARSRFQTRWYQDVKRVPHDLTRILNYFRNKTVPLATDTDVRPADPASWSNQEFCAVTFSAAETSALQAKAKQQQVSLNDFFLAEYFRVLLEWNRSREQQLFSRSLRLAVPINMRPANSPNLEPAVNGVSMVFLDRDQQQIENNQLLPSISHEMTDVKRWQTGWALILSLAAAGCVRNGMVRLVTSSGPRITSGLSNLGKVFARSELSDPSGKLRADTWTLERIDPFPPVRPGVFAAADVLTYANQLTLSINYDRFHLSQPSAQALLNQFAHRLGYREPVKTAERS